KATSVLPDVTVESLRVGDDKRLARFNIRTTEQSPEVAKNKIQEAFGTTLARVEMTYGEGKPISGASAAPLGEAAKTSPAPLTRFAGGREYELSFNTTAFNSTAPPAQVISAVFASVLEKAKIANPTSRFEILNAPDRGGAGEPKGSSSAGTKLV